MKTNRREGGEAASGAGSEVAAAEASAKITERIRGLGDWRGEMLAEVRRLIHEAERDIVEEWKWVSATKPGTPVWSHGGIVCTGESYKEVVKLTFARGASIADPKKLFNSSLDGNMRRAIDIREGEKIKAAAFKELIRAAVGTNAGVGASNSEKKLAGKKRTTTKRVARSK